MTASTNDSLGGRLPLTNRAELNPQQQELFDHMMETMIPWAQKARFQSQTDDGRLIGPFNPVLLSPAVARSFLDLQEVEGRDSSLSPRLRQVIILAVGAVWGADYELYAHAAVARQAGLPATVVGALVAGLPAEGLDEPERIAEQFTHQLSAQHSVQDAVYRDAERVLGRRAIADMIFLIGIYHTVSALLCGFAIPAPA